MASSELQARYHEPVTLRGRHVHLVPLGPDHAAALFAALGGDEEVWRYIPVAQPRTLAEMQDWVRSSLEEQAHGRRLPFAVVEQGGGEVVGSTSFVSMSAADRHLDVGWTWYAKAYWRSAVNTECKYLLFRHAFETLRCIRVQLRVDERNLRSQRAVERIGGVREGVLRKAQILYDGHERYVVLFSLLDDEWPARKAWFEQVLAR